REDVRRRRLTEQVVDDAALGPAVPVGAGVVEHQHVGTGLFQPGADGPDGALGGVVVAVEEPDVVAGGHVETDVAGGAEPHVLVEMADADARVAFGELVEYLPAAVR